MTTTEAAIEHVDAGTDQEVDSSESHPAVELRWVDPRELIIGANIRTKPVLPKWYVDDIEDRGVREPISVREAAPGQLVVRKGQRRTFGAVQVWERALAKGTEPKHKVVPVLVEPELITDEVKAEIDRIVDQFGENEHRASISDADEVRATQQLLDLGLSAGQIAKRRHVSTKRVKTAAAVASSSVAAELLSTGAIQDLTYAAVIAEFADDEAAVSELTTVASKRPGQFDHIAQQLRDRREEQRLCAELAAEASAQGVTVIDEPSSQHDSPVRELDRLRPSAESDDAELTAEQHKDCPGHAAYIGDRGSWRPVTERFAVVYVCTDAAAHGHVDRYVLPTTGTKSAPMTAEEKAARKRVVANNKAWRSAETVRRKWLKSFLGRKSAPRDAIKWSTKILAEGGPDLRKAMEKDHPLALELLGMPKQDLAPYFRHDEHPIAAAVDKATPARAATLMVALLVAATEAGTGTHTWRNPSKYAQAYLAQLQAWGYTLSDVEQLVLHAGEEAEGDSESTEDGGPGRGVPDSVEPEQADELDAGSEAASEIDPVAEGEPETAETPTMSTPT